MHRTIPRFGLCALALALVACGGDDAAPAGGADAADDVATDTSTGGDAGTSDADDDTTDDASEDATGDTAAEDAGEDASADAGEDTSDDGGGDASTDAGAPFCGDGERNGDEICDGDDVGALTCASLGQPDGTLRCNDTCDAVDLSGCGVEPGCGDGTIDDGELCDTTDLGGLSCEALGLDGGTLTCNDACDGFDTSACEGGGGSTCDGVAREPGELCDGDDLNDTTCVDLGFDRGDLACNDACDGFDTTACENDPPTCGDDAREGDEACDGTDVPTDCVALGFDGGTLGCNDACDGFDTTGCTDECAPTCGDRECGPDPTCGTPCGTCDTGFRCTDAGACEPDGDRGPRIIRFNTDVGDISEGETVTFSAVVTDPDGIDDLIGGTLDDPVTGRSYGSFSTAASEGAYSITLTWAQMHRLRDIDFTEDTDRTFEAVFFDVGGSNASATTTVTLTCDGDAACDGTCTPLGTNADCGACGDTCGGGTTCDAGACTCPGDLALCDGTCTALDTAENCGDCGVSCGAGALCDDGGCACPGGWTACDGDCVVTAIDRLNCGDCGTVCGDETTACSRSECVCDDPNNTERLCAGADCRAAWRWDRCSCDGGAGGGGCTGDQACVAETCVAPTEGTARMVGGSFVQVYADGAWRWMCSALDRDLDATDARTVCKAIDAERMVSYANRRDLRSTAGLPEADGVYWLVDDHCYSISRDLSECVHEVEADRSICPEGLFVQVVCGYL